MIRFDDILEKVTASYAEKDITLLKKAYVFAAQAHKGQTRRSGEPYLSHSLEVANMLADMRLDKTTLAAGLLHDVLEDTETTAAELKQAFGKEIAHLVEGVTKISQVQESSPKARQAESIRKIILAMTDDLRVIFIKLADRIHNLKTLKYLPEEKQKHIAKETLEIYAPIANRLGMGRIKAELEDHSFRFVNPDGYFKIASLVDPRRKKAEKELKKIRVDLVKLMEENHVPAEITYRTKRLYSINSKMTQRNIDFDQVYDFMALRLITDTVKNCYSALGIIHQKWPHLPHRFRDLIAMPKPNLYQSLHTTIITEKNQFVEIQIRTEDMHNLAEDGISAHWKYKETDPSLIVKEDKRLQWLREMVDFYKEQRNPREFLKSLKTDLIPEEVYVFTPKGTVITLPHGASALDFAFKIHTEIGLHASAAKINGKMTPLKTILKTGDVAEILTSPDKKPRREWLHIVFTSTARHRIKRWLNLQDRLKNASLGKRLWEKEIKNYRLPQEWLKSKKVLKRLSSSTKLRYKSMDDFFANVGSGKVILDRKFFLTLFPSEKIMEKRETFLKKVAKKVTKKPSPLIQTKGFNLAKCCSPIKGEPIVGYITSGRGMTVHALRCPRVVKEILDNKRMVDVSWDHAPKESYTGKLTIKGEDSPGVLAKIASAIAQQEGNITKAIVTTSTDKTAQFRLTINIQDIKQFEAIIKKLSGIKEIFSVEKI